ncbi:MAG: DUF3857 domain-containing protein [Acidobacteria bacterium]|nr:DUF3857 domain-containing protein [Acidobacteriota bacterium]
MDPRPPLLHLVLLTTCLLAPGLARAEEDYPPLVIEAGPAVISESERALTADPAAGIEHAVILVEDTDYNESLPTSVEVSYHLRAKILSNEGRELANITIPHNMKRGKLKKWWGRTILPDGKVLELPEHELTPQTIAKYSSIFQYSVLKGALPGVVPGAVIDVGYTVRAEQDHVSTQTVELQRPWPVRRLRYRWVPFRGYSASYVLLHGEGRDVSVNAGRSAVMISANNLDPLPDEPLMPPAREVRASVILYYLLSSERTPQAYWDLEAKRLDRETASYCARSHVQHLLAAMQIAPDLDLEGKLRAAYDWIGANLRIESLATAEEQEEAAADDEGDRSRRETLNTLLETKKGSTSQLTRAFIAAARQLGAEAELVLGADRTEGFWNPQLMDVAQLPWRFAAVRAPGAKDWTFVAPGQGLPYGQVPWWLTGVSGFVAAKAGGQAVPIPPAQADQSVRETSAKVTFGEENESIGVAWSQRGSGQVGYGTRRWLRQMTPDEREKELQDICGASEDFEVTESATANLDDLSAAFEITCSGEFIGDSVDPEVGTYGFTWSGPWVQALPDVVAPKRRHPVVFNYPYVDHAVIEVTAPHGFVPKAPPAPVDLSGAFGNFHRTISATETGFRIERTFALRAVVAKAEYYDLLLRWLQDIRKSDLVPVEFRRAEQRQ